MFWAITNATTITIAMQPLKPAALVRHEPQVLYGRLAPYMQRQLSAGSLAGAWGSSSNMSGAPAGTAPPVVAAALATACSMRRWAREARARSAARTGGAAACCAGQAAASTQPHIALALEALPSAAAAMPGPLPGMYLECNLAFVWG